MHFNSPQRYWFFALAALVLALCAVSLRDPHLAGGPRLPDHETAPRDIAVAEAAPQPTDAPKPTAPPQPTAQPVGGPAEAPAEHQALAEAELPEPAAAAPAAAPTQLPARQGPPRVGLQVGHWKSNELPDELARLRTSTGARAGNITEAQVNLDVAQRVAKLLESVGVQVDILPATVPQSYDADAFIAIHSDGSSNTKARGFKLATPWRASRASILLMDVMTEEYGRATGLPPGGAPTINMRGYYAFTTRRQPHAIAPTTPAVIIELAFLTNATDRWYLTTQQDNLAVGVANGIIRYLNERDPNDRAALIPPDFPPQRAADPAGVGIRAAPRDDARVILEVPQERLLVPLQEQGEWFQVVARGEWGKIGWVRKSDLRPSSDPTPVPPPPSDS